MSRYTGGRIVDWLEERFVTPPSEIQSRHVRSFLSELGRRGLSDDYIHLNARVIKTFVRFPHAERYIQKPITIPMPAFARKRMPVLSPNEFKRVLAACGSDRDKAIVPLLLDSGLRAAKALALDWFNVNIPSGPVRVRNGKAGKDRSAVLGTTARRAPIKYGPLSHRGDGDPLIQSKDGSRLTYSGLRALMLRLSKRSSVYIRPHILRRSFAAWSLRFGMSLLHLQALLGHSTLEMVRRFSQIMDDDLTKADGQHGPVDSLLR